ncbi:MAG: N-acetylmuramoyl-L-alanine amidase [Aestuariivirga sp.]
MPARRAYERLCRSVVTLCIATIILLLQAPPAELLAAELQATAARIAGDETRTRFVADISKPASYSVYVLPDPFRVVIDLPETDFLFPAGAGKKVRGLVREFRYGSLEGGRSRIVIDTNGPALIEKSYLVEAGSDKPARLVVDLVVATEETFLASFGEAKPPEADPEERAKQSAALETSPIPFPRPKPGSEPAAPKQEATAPERVKTRKLIVIDPGHGGIDPGAIGAKGTREKDVVLVFGKAFRDALAALGKYDVVMTRSDDRFLSLKDRVGIARQKQADLFIAIHADTVRGQSARGATVYTLSKKASDAEAEALAQKENAADIIGGVDVEGENQEVTDILIDLVQRETKNHSITFAKKAVGELKQATRMTGKPLRSAGFVVLKAPDVPSVLIELGFLSSRADEEQLTSPKWRKGVAASLTKAIDRYFSTEVATKSD